MFLTERSVNNTFNLNDLISESYENILEFDNQYHELCMKMIKVEHMALVQGNTSMLHEAEETFKTRLINALKTAWNNFVSFINKAIVALSSLQVKIKTKYLNKDNLELIKEMIEKVEKANKNSDYFLHQLIGYVNDFNSTQVNSILNVKKLDGIITNMASLLDNNNLADKTDDINKMIDDLKEFRGIKTKTTNVKNMGNGEIGKLLTNAVLVLENREKWIEIVKRLKNTGKTKECQLISRIAGRAI